MTDVPMVTEAARRPIGMIGLGIMGSAMAASLRRAGVRVIGATCS